MLLLLLGRRLFLVHIYVLLVSRFQHPASIKRRKHNLLVRTSRSGSYRGSHKRGLPFIQLVQVDLSRILSFIIDYYQFQSLAMRQKKRIRSVPLSEAAALTENKLMPHAGGQTGITVSVLIFY